MEKVVLKSCNEDFGLITEWIPKHSLGHVMVEVATVVNQYFKFIKSIDESVKGIHIVYEKIDSDFGHEKWLILFKENYEKDEFTSEIKYEIK